jgi:hypothetical protein
MVDKETKISTRALEMIDKLIAGAKHAVEQTSSVCDLHDLLRDNISGTGDQKYRHILYVTLNSLDANNRCKVAFGRSLIPCCVPDQLKDPLVATISSSTQKVLPPKDSKRLEKRNAQRQDLDVI